MISGKVKNLGDAFDYYYAHKNEFPCNQLTKAFKEMMTSYNKMTNAYTVKGDVNGDGEVNIEDATLVQKYVAHIENLTGAQKMLTNEKIMKTLRSRLQQTFRNIS